LETDTIGKEKAMDIQNMTIEDILGLALVTEIHGRQFYENLAEKVSHPEVKMRISSLANDERRHQALIENFFRTLLNREPQMLPVKGVPDILKAIASLQINNKTQVLQVLDMAIEAEVTATKFYQHGASIATDPKVRQVFEEMEREEDSHFQYLVAEKAALSGDLYWFSIDDSAMMEE
jgi:rubrerythrin